MATKDKRPEKDKATITPPPDVKQKLRDEFNKFAKEANYIKEDKPGHWISNTSLMEMFEKIRLSDKWNQRGKYYLFDFARLAYYTDLKDEEWEKFVFHELDFWEKMAEEEVKQQITKTEKLNKLNELFREVKEDTGYIAVTPNYGFSDKPPKFTRLYPAEYSQKIDFLNGLLEYYKNYIETQEPIASKTGTPAFEITAKQQVLLLYYLGLDRIKGLEIGKTGKLISRLLNRSEKNITDYWRYLGTNSEDNPETIPNLKFIQALFTELGMNDKVDEVENRIIKLETTPKNKTP